MPPRYLIIQFKIYSKQILYLDEMAKSIEPIHIVLDSTGLKIYDEGKWKVRQNDDSNADTLIRDEPIRYRNEVRKTNWKIDLRYSRRSIVETAMYRFKTPSVLYI